VNLAGLPGISVPCDDVQLEEKSLPVGLQIIGKALDETTILQVAHAFERSRANA
jgi:aspartyl-tRNA(Asn)/glutamyl-tRNA(Gln) amidotransferase subunit A